MNKTGVNSSWDSKDSNLQKYLRMILRQQLILSGKSLGKFCKDLGVPTSYYSQFISGKRGMGLQKVINIYRRYNLDLNTLKDKH